MFISDRDMGKSCWWWLLLKLFVATADTEKKIYETVKKKRKFGVKVKEEGKKKARDKWSAMRMQWMEVEVDKRKLIIPPKRHLLRYFV